MRLLCHTQHDHVKIKQWHINNGASYKNTMIEFDISKRHIKLYTKEKLNKVW
jgi:hypothetical protein